METSHTLGFPLMRRINGRSGRSRFHDDTNERNESRDATMLRAWDEADVWKHEWEAVLEVARAAEDADRQREDVLARSQVLRAVELADIEEDRVASLAAEAVVVRDELNELHKGCAICKEDVVLLKFACCQFKNGICEACFADPRVTTCPICRMPRERMYIE